MTPLPGVPIADPPASDGLPLHSLAATADTGGPSEESRLHRACAGQPGDSHHLGTRRPTRYQEPSAR